MGPVARHGADGEARFQVEDGTMRGKDRVLFIHEYVTGGGLAGSPLPSSLAAEGAAMRRRLAADFAAVDGVRVVMTLDDRLDAEPGPWEVVRVALGRELDAFRRLAAEADHTLLIAPRDRRPPPRSRRDPRPRRRPARSARPPPPSPSPATSSGSLACSTGWDSHARDLRQSSPPRACPSRLLTPPSSSRSTAPALATPTSSPGRIICRRVRWSLAKRSCSRTCREGRSAPASSSMMRVVPP